MQGTSLGIVDHRPWPFSIAVFATQRARLCPTAGLMIAHPLRSRTSPASLPAIYFEKARPNLRLQLLHLLHYKLQLGAQGP